MRKYGDLTGQIFGRLRVINKTLLGWNCKCSCGNKVIKTGRALIHDKTKSCGCLQKEARSKNAERLIKPETFLTRWFKIYKYTAQRKQTPWNLSLQEFENIVTRPCYLCGAKPEPRPLCRSTRYNKKICFSGIDRFDNTKGYTKENARPCCTLCNKQKLNMSYKEFLLHIKTILEKANAENGKVS